MFEYNAAGTGESNNISVAATPTNFPAGLLVTAWVCFRRPRSRNRKLPPNNVVGA